MEAIKTISDVAAISTISDYSSMLIQVKNVFYVSVLSTMVDYISMPIHVSFLILYMYVFFYHHKLIV